MSEPPTQSFPTPFLASKTVTLRPIVERDQPLFVQWMNNPEVRRYLRMFMPLTLEQEKKWQADSVDMSQKSDRITLAIVLNGDKLIGDIGLHEISCPDQSAWIGYQIGAVDCWGQGCATDAAALFLDYTFGELNFRKIMAGIYEPNVRSRGVAKKLGFTLASITKDEIFVDGKYRDCCIYELFRDEWLANRERWVKVENQ